MCKKLLNTGLYCKNKVAALGFCKKHLPKKIEDCCCICYSDINYDNCLDCDHFICLECVSKLRDDKCPVCRSNLKGKKINPKILNEINNRKKLDKKERENSIEFINFINNDEDLMLAFHIDLGGIILYNI